MKKRLLYMLSILILGVFSFTSFSCSSDDDESGSGLSGTWYLVTYGSSYCTHGEYWKISGSTLKWNSRLGGNNTTYSISVTSRTIDAKCTSCTSGSKSDWDAQFTYYIQDGVLVTEDDHGMLRTFSRSKP